MFTISEFRSKSLTNCITFQCPLCCLLLEFFKFVENDGEGIAVQKPLTRKNVICQSERMFRPHHDLKTLGTKSTSAINTVYLIPSKAKHPFENPGAKEIGRFLVKGSIMVYCILFV